MSRTAGVETTSTVYDRAVISTADDAILAKVSCVDKGYYEDPFLRDMARGATGLVERNRTSAASSVATEPIIRRGTHARVRAVERAIESFLALPLSSSSSTSDGVERDTANRDGGGEATTPANGRENEPLRQVVVLGAGRDTTYLRYRFRNKRVASDDNGSATDVEGNVRWYEVDHPSLIRQKAQCWLPRCIPTGYDYSFECVRDTGISSDDHNEESSYAVSIRPQHTQQGTRGAGGYHLVGHDLRSPHATLLRAMSRCGYDRRRPTLFVLECVAMYLPAGAVRELLRCLAESPLSPKEGCAPVEDTLPFVAVVLYDPIPLDDRFGRTMIDNLRRAGIAIERTMSRPRCRDGAKDAGNDDESDDEVQLSLETTSTLSAQLARLVSAGFDVATGCDMLTAYDYGVISTEDRRRAMQCEMLDELEEFQLLMRHYCLCVGVATGGASRCNKATIEHQQEGIALKNRRDCIGYKLCDEGRDSLMGFQEGHCTIVNRLNG